MESDINLDILYVSIIYKLLKRHIPNWKINISDAVFPHLNELRFSFLFLSILLTYILYKTLGEKLNLRFMRRRCFKL